MPPISQPDSNSDATYAELAKFAGRIAVLLRLPKVHKNTHLLGCLDDFLGAIYALWFAKERDFKDRVAIPIEVDKVVKRADQLATREVRPDGKWMAGFHFNSALLRMAAVYHRALKVVVGKPETTDFVNKLQPIAAKLYPQWTSQVWQSGNIEKVYREMNHLKHTSKGVYAGRTVGYQDAIQAVKEVFLDLIEAWAQQPYSLPNKTA